MWGNTQRGAQANIKHGNDCHHGSTRNNKASNHHEWVFDEAKHQCLSSYQITRLIRLEIIEFLRVPFGKFAAIAVWNARLAPMWLWNRGALQNNLSSPAHRLQFALHWWEILCAESCPFGDDCLMEKGWRGWWMETKSWGQNLSREDRTWVMLFSTMIKGVQIEEMISLVYLRE